MHILLKVIEMRIIGAAFYIISPVSKNTVLIVKICRMEDYCHLSISRILFYKE